MGEILSTRHLDGGDTLHKTFRWGIYSPKKQQSITTRMISPESWASMFAFDNCLLIVAVDVASQFTRQCPKTTRLFKERWKKLNLAEGGRGRVRKNVIRKRETAGKAKQATHFRSIQTERSHDSFQLLSPHKRKHDMTVPPSRHRERERQTDRDRDRQRQTETERDRQTETDRQTDRLRQRQTDRDRQKQTDRQRQTQTDRYRETVIEKQRDTERDTDTETQRHTES